MALIITLNLRNLRSGLNRQLSCIASNLNLLDAVVQVAARLPNLRCFVVDGQVDSGLDKHYAQLLRPLEHLNLLSLAHCRVSLPLSFFSREVLAGLTYLDLSNSGSSARILLANASSFSASNLPNLGVLKLAGRALDITDAFRLLCEFSRQLWSIDLSNNKLDGFVIPLLCRDGSAYESRQRLQSNKYFDVEGMLRAASMVPDTFFVHESNFSADFSHPDRYLADAPLYTVDNIYGSDVSGRRSGQRARLQGHEPVRGDSADDMIKALAGGPHDHTPTMPEISHPNLVNVNLTHVHLNGLVLLRSKDLEEVLESNAGRLEHLECDTAIYFPKDDWSDDKPHHPRFRLHGFPGAAHLFRPVYQSNLRVLKIHHSLVTNTPTLTTNDAPFLENFWRSEVVFCKQNDLAFPQRFCPDMNPRIYSLTLSRVPQHSTGVVTDRLIHFLKLAAVQEQNIERMKAAIPHRGPPVLRGLRHIRLEFEPESKGDLDCWQRGEDMEEAMKEFASFNEVTWDSELSSSSQSVKSIMSKNSATSGTPKPIGPQHMSPSEERLTGGPFADTAGEEYYVVRCRHMTYDGPARIWIGSGVVSPANPPAVNAYMRNLAADENGKFLSDFAPASPSHVAAGVPHGSYIFRKAWERILLPSLEDLALRPTMADLRGMEDVLKGIKAFRSETREKYHAALAQGNGSDVGKGDHGFWTGKLEIEFPRAQTNSADFGR